MAVIEKFLGQRVEVPDTLRYDVRQGLWARCQNQGIVFGLSQPALVLAGGVKDMDWLVEEGRAVSAGESVVFAITGKITYLDSPLAGIVQFNQAVRAKPTLITSDPYQQGWLFVVQPGADIDHLYRTLAPVEAYLDSLRGSEGFKNPDGLKGGVSGICKAVYSGIGQQKI